MGVMILITTAIASNNRNKLDTTATAISQMVLERIAAQSVSTVQNCLTPTSVPCVRIQDCRPASAGGPQSWTIATAGAGGSGQGAKVDVATGNIDYIQTYAAVPANYKMLFVSCGAAGQQATYDVRWNVQTITGFSKLVTVSTRQIGATAGGAQQLKFFAPPVTLRTIAGM
ncbi:MAG: hypothetical protein ACRD2R_01955, partial [Terriglobales bacterium]